MLSLFINWDISPEIFNLGGISIRYYGLLFAVAFILGYKVEEKMFKSEGLPMAWLDKLWLYVAIATIVGARSCLYGFRPNLSLPVIRDWPVMALQ